MPVILVNNAASIEVDISAALKHTINKGAFDVVLEYTGHPEDTGTVVIVLRSHAITERFIKLDWRDISSPVVASAEALRDLLLSWNIPLTIIQSSALPAGAATEVTQAAINTAIGAKNDSAATTDTGTFSLISLFKRLLQGITTIFGNQTNGTQKTRIVDIYGFGVENTPTDELRVVSPFRLVGANFEGNTLDPNYWLSTIANSAAIAQSNAQVLLSSGTNNAGSAILNSNRRSRYVSGSSCGYRAVIQLGDTGIANNERKWGIAYGATMPTITDGAYFKLSGTTFSVELLKGGSPTTISSGSFNGASASYSLSTDVATYEIYWTNSKVYFVINGVLIHTFSATLTAWSATMNHHIYTSNINSGNTTNVTLSLRVASIRRFGLEQTQPMIKFQSGTTAGLVLKYGPGNLHGISISGVAQNSVVTLYNNIAASGEILWSSGTMGANAVPFGIDMHNAPFGIGLTLVISGASSNATVIYE